MKFPKFKFFTVLLTHFGCTTIIISFLITLSIVIKSESDAEEFIASKSERIYYWLFSNDWAETLDLDGMELSAKDMRGDIAISKIPPQQAVIEDNNYANLPLSIATAQNFPTLEKLIHNSKPVGRLFFGYFDGHYYLLAKNERVWLAVRSSYIDWLVYPNWLSMWPLALLVAVIISSYLLLRYWLAPVKAALLHANEISQGNFDYRISKHPNNELAELTHGLNNMAHDLSVLFEAKRSQLLTISHELKTPIARARLSLANLAEDKIKSEVNSDLAQMEAMINQLLEIEKLAVHLTITVKPYWLPTLFEEIINETEFIDKVAFVSAIPESIVKLDRVRFHILLRNLIDNGLKYGNNEKVNIDVDISDNTLCIKVSDQGNGLPSEELEKIFEPFYRDKKHTKQYVHGAGLGLYLSQRIVQAHKGKISVTSSLGMGSCFTILLPI